MQGERRRVSRSAVPSRALAAAVSALAAWLLVATHLATALHFVLISHHFCAEHGDLVHGTPLVAQREHGGQAAAALPGGEQESDEHCPLLSRRLEHNATVPAFGHRVASAPLERTLACTRADGIAASPSELLLAAPKQSPPG